MSYTVSDLYSKILLTENMQPVFRQYYNIEFRDGFAMPPHEHEFVEIMYVRKGFCEVYAGDGKYRLEAGDFILLNGNVRHRLHVDKKVACKVLCLEFDFIHGGDHNNILSYIYGQVKEVRHLLDSANEVLKLKDTAEVYTVLSDIYREANYNECGRNEYIEAGFAQLLIKLARIYAESENNKKDSAGKYIKDAIAFMNNSYHEDISVDSIAEHVSLNVSYLHKIFKKSTGHTPMDYLNNIRISKAKMLLQKYDLPVTEVCNFVGFNSRQYFAYVFKKQTGMTPIEYRKSTFIGKLPGEDTKACRQNISDI